MSCRLYRTQQAPNLQLWLGRKGRSDAATSGGWIFTAVKSGKVGGRQMWPGGSNPPVTNFGLVLELLDAPALPFLCLVPQAHCWEVMCSWDFSVPNAKIGWSDPAGGGWLLSKSSRPESQLYLFPKGMAAPRITWHSLRY